MLTRGRATTQQSARESTRCPTLRVASVSFLLVGAGAGIVHSAFAFTVEHCLVERRIWWEDFSPHVKSVSSNCVSDCERFDVNATMRMYVSPICMGAGSRLLRVADEGRDLRFLYTIFTS